MEMKVHRGPAIHGKETLLKSDRCLISPTAFCPPSSHPFLRHPIIRSKRWIYKHGERASENEALVATEMVCTSVRKPKAIPPKTTALPCQVLLILLTPHIT